MGDLELYLSDLGGVTRDTPHTELMKIFGFFLTQIVGEPEVTAKRLQDCYDAAGLKQPWRMSDAMQKSRAFVKSGKKLALHRDVKNEIASRLKSVQHDVPSAVVSAKAIGASTRNTTDTANTLMVVHGRNLELRDALYVLLRSLNLNPIEWERAIKETGNASPYVGEILDKAFEMANAVIVLLSPDEKVELDRNLAHDEKDWEKEKGYQSRPNVFLEAGMALARNQNKTIILQVGDHRPVSDIVGRHILKFDGSAEKRNALVNRLRTAGCHPDVSGDDWLRLGNFSASVKKA